MTSLNLQPFWAVQPASGLSSHLFSSEKEAMEKVNSWTKNIEDEFSFWEKGESSNSAIVNSTIEPDGFGGCYQAFSIAPHALPGAIYHYEVGTQSPSRWEDCPGFEKIRWGNPATARP